MKVSPPSPCLATTDTRSSLPGQILLEHLVRVRPIPQPGRTRRFTSNAECLRLFREWIRHMLRPNRPIASEGPHSPSLARARTDSRLRRQELDPCPRFPRATAAPCPTLWPSSKRRPSTRLKWSDSTSGSLLTAMTLCSR